MEIRFIIKSLWFAGLWRRDGGVGVEWAPLQAHSLQRGNSGYNRNEPDNRQFPSTPSYAFITWIPTLIP